MSGLEVEHNGSQLIKIIDSNLLFSNKSEHGSNATNAFSVSGIYKMALVPKYIIADVRKASPAAEAGIKVGDVLLGINENNLANYKIGEIINLLSKKEGKKVRVAVDRAGTRLNFEFRLKKLL